MAFSNNVNAGDVILASQYNNLRKDIVDTIGGHTHDETDSRKLATLNTTTGHNHDDINSKKLANNSVGINQIQDESIDNNKIQSTVYLIGRAASTNVRIGEGTFGDIENPTATDSTAIGFQAGYNANAVSENSFFGYSAGYRCNTNQNTFIGALSGSGILGNLCTNIGYNTGEGSGISPAYNTGTRNTNVGAESGKLSSGSNNSTFGFNAQVPNDTQSNQVRIGNDNVTYAGVKVAWTITSDIRYKKNIKPLELGLDFINQLNPVEYQRKSEENSFQKDYKEWGLIAQDFEEILNKNNIEKVSVLSKDKKGFYSIKYNDLIAPLIKSIQELSKENKELKKRMARIESI